MNDYINFFLNIKIIIICVGIYLFYKLGQIKYNLHLKLGCKGPPPLPFIGNFLDMVRYGIHKCDVVHSKLYGKLYPFYLGNVKLIMVSDEELLKQILIKEAKCFTDRLDTGFNGKITEKMLTVLKGKDWERVRNLVTPTFTSGKLKKMSPLISDCVTLMEERFSNHPPNQPIDFKEFFGTLTFDIIARTMFGMHVDSQLNPNNQFMLNAKKLLNFTLLNPILIFFVIFPELAGYFHKIFPNWELLGYKTLYFFINNLEKAIKERKKSSEEFNDFLALMLKANKEIENSPNQSETLASHSLTNQEIMAQSIIFLLAGYETTAMTLTFCTYFLAKNLDAQEEVYNEILEKIKADGKINYESLMNMPILDSFLNETMRLCPALPRIDRQCTRNISLTSSEGKTITIKKGEVLTIPIYAIHMDPEIWPNPDQFDIHRFDPDKKKNISPYSFMPFGAGPRNCVGMRFAQLEIKWALVNVLQKFQIVPCAETMDVIQFKNTGISTSAKPIILKVVKRK